MGDSIKKVDSTATSGELKGYQSTEAGETSRWQSFKDSFKPAVLEGYDTTNMTELEKAALATANAPLNRALKNRHIQMIAIGGSIGTGLFVGSGKALANGGPAALLLGFIVIGVMLYCTIQALGELAVVYPVSGAFATYSSRFLDPSWGFAMGWTYALQWLISLPVELVAASITINYWQSDINSVAWISIFYVLILALNVVGVKGYGEGEFVFSLIKVVAVVGFIILGICINCGVGENGVGYIGGKYWQDPGAFSHGFKGFCAVFVTAAFSFTGTELVGLAAAETKNPRKALPSATKQVFWRITLFYVVSLTIVGLIVPYSDKRLLGQTSSVDVKASPFVVAINNAGIKVLPSIMNAVVLIAVLSVGNSAVFASSRTVTALAAQGLAPKIFTYIDRNGRPLASLVLSAVFGLISFVSASNKQAEVFSWLMALAGLASIFTWGSICICHIRFRRALKYYGRSLDEVPFKSQVGVIGSYLGVGINALILIAQFWIALFPIGGKPNAADFFQAYLAVPVVSVLFIGCKVYTRSKFVTMADIDLDVGRRDVDLDLLQQEVREEEAYIASKPFYYKFYKFWC